jgi:hypothetical protein
MLSKALTVAHMMLQPGKIAATAAAVQAMSSSRLVLLIKTKRWATVCAALQQRSLCHGRMVTAAAVQARVLAALEYPGRVREACSTAQGA